jgi:hypothetical protein
MGGWADGLITVAAARDQMKEIVESFRAGGGGGKPIFLQVALSFASSEEDALRAAHEEWRHAVLSPHQLSDVESPAAFVEATARVTRDEVREKIRVSSSLDQHVEWLAADAELGFERLFLHNVHRDQESFIARFANKVLPALRA